MRRMVRIGATASLLLLAASYAYARAPYWKRSEHLFVLLEDGVSIDTILSTPIGSNFILESTHGRLATISPKTYASEILNPGAEVKLQGGNDGKATNLKACIGECDSDKQCAEGLKCFQRDGYESIPGCAGRGKKAWDYCYSPEASFGSKIPKAVSSKLASLKPQIELAAKANVDMLSTLPGVRSVSKNELDDVEVNALRGDRKLSAQVDPTWGLDVIDGSIDGSYAHNYDGSGVHIYVVDSGLRLTHEEFAGRIGEGVNFFDLDASTMFDDCGHGTHVASTALGNKWGVAKGATLHPVRVFGWNGVKCRGTTADILDAITWSADHAKQNGWRCVINLSLGGYSKHAEYAEAVHDAVEKGCVVVAAAGNDGGDACSVSPAKSVRALTVGALDPPGTGVLMPRSTSKTGKCVSIWAPGAAVAAASHLSDTDWISKSGTSMAAPHVAGIAAQTWQLHPDESSAAITDRIIDYGRRNIIANLDDESPNILAITPVAAPGYRYFPNRDIDGSTYSSMYAVNSGFCAGFCSTLSNCVGFETEMRTGVVSLCTLKKEVTEMSEKSGENAYVRSTIEVSGAGTTEANGIYSRINTKDVFYFGGVPLESIKAAWQKDDWQIYVRTDGSTTNEWWIEKSHEVFYKSVGNPEAVKATLFQPPTEWHAVDHADVIAPGPTIQQNNINILDDPDLKIGQVSDVATEMRRF